MGEETEHERFALVIRLPREVEIRIEDLYLHLGGTTKPILGYHITLFGPFCLENGREPPHDAVRGIAEQLIAFDVQLDGMESYQSPDNNVVFLELVDPTRVAAIHTALLQALKDDITWADPRLEEWMVARYHPHVTLGLGLSDRELGEILSIGASHPLQATFHVTRMCMARQLPHGPWEFVAEYPFFGERSSGRPGSQPCAR